MSRPPPPTAQYSKRSGRWHVASGPADKRVLSTISFDSETACIRYMDEQEARTPEVDEIAGIPGDVRYEAIAYQIPQLATRAELAAYLEDPRTDRTLRALRIFHPSLHERALALIDAARAFAE